MHTCIRKPASLFIISLLCGLMMRQPAFADDDEDALQKMKEKAKAFSLISHEEAKTGKARQTSPSMRDVASNPCVSNC